MTHHDPRLRGLYLITDPGCKPLACLLARVEQALEGGARLVQYRDKGADTERREREASALLKLSRLYGAALIINDDVALAARLGVGVHLGIDDSGIDKARSELGDEAIIGISCYDSLQRAREAQAQGADYVAFGSFYDSPTKPRAGSAPLALLAQAQEVLNVPVCAIGGITLETAPLVVEAGADMIAVISAVFNAKEPLHAARHLTQVFDA